MGKWSRKFGNILTAAGISLIVAAGAFAMPIEASAARTVTDDVMIRNDASTEAGIIGSLNEGDEVTILDVTQSADGYAWYYIQLENGATGFVRSDLIEADDSELAGFSQEVQNEPQTQQEEAEAEPDQASEQEQEFETSSQEQEAVSEEAADVTVQTDAEGYDATKDPNANFRTGYETEADGTVTWYVYNDDNGSKVRISDLQGQQAAPAAGSEGPGIWRPLAIIFGILTIGLAAFALFLIKSIQEGRSKTTRGRALEAAAAMEDEEEDEFIFEDDEDDEEEEEPAADTETAESDEEQEETDAETAPEADKAMPDSTITMDVPDESEPVVIGEEQIEAIVEEDTVEPQDGIAAEETEEVLEVTEPEQDIETEQEEPRQDAEFEEEDAQESLSTMPEDEVFEEGEENLEEDAEEVFDEDEDYDSEDEDEDYDSEDEDEDYVSEDEDYEDEEEYDEEEYEDDEDEEETRTGAKASSKGGFFGFLKKIFGTETKEDHEDEEEYEDYNEDEPEEHEFDEFKEYPEDIDLLPREDRDDEESFDDEEEYYEQEDPAEDTSRSRLSMDRVMKNVSYKEEEADFSGDDDPNDLMDSLFEDDDDMEYSFITSTRRK